MAGAREHRGRRSRQANATATTGTRTCWHAKGRKALDVARGLAMSSVAWDCLSFMLREFDAQLQKADNPGAWTCVVMDDAAALFGTRGLVKIRGAIDGEPFDGALMAQGDGTHRLPVKAKIREAIGKRAGDTVRVRIDERIG
jgi:uncharacterized protein DUF1905